MTSAYPFVAIDTETYLITPEQKFPELVTLQYKVYDTEEVIFIHKPQMRDYARDVLYNLLEADLDWVFFNAAYDVPILLRTFPELQPNFRESIRRRLFVVDLFVNERLLNISKGRNTFPSLADCTKKYLNKELAKPAVRMQYGELADRIKADPDTRIERDFVTYAIEDAKTTHELFSAMPPQPDVRAQSLNAVALAWYGATGFQTDAAKVALVKEQLKAKRAEMIPQLVEKKILSIKGNIDNANYKRSVKLLQKMVTDAYKKPPLTEKGGVKTDRATLRESNEETLELAADFLELDKTWTNEIPLLEKASQNRIQPQYNVLVVTGRTSCSKPNIQKIPRGSGIRECFVPDAGNVFISADYDAAELRSLAQCHLDMFKQSKLAEVFNSDGEDDPHLSVAADFLKISYAEAKERKESKDPELLAKRHLAKCLNFGLAGGMGADTFVRHAKKAGITLTRNESQSLKNAWVQKWLPMPKYFAVVSALHGKGETFVSGRPFEGKRYTEHCNIYFQARTADGAKRAASLVFLECLKGGMLEGSKPWLFLHDEIGLETPVDKAETHARILEALMLKGMAEFVPDVKVKVTAKVSDCWRKG